MKIAKGLHRIGSDTVNSYLVVGEDGVTIIDAGLPRYWRLLNSELARLGKTVDDVRALVLTHGDSDHLGFAERLRRDHGVPVHIHEADAARARGEVKSSPSWGPMKPGAMAGFLGYKLPLIVRRAVTMLPALIVLAIGVNPTSALIFSQVVLSFGIPLALIPLVVVTGRRGAVVDGSGQSNASSNALRPPRAQARNNVRRLRP